MQKQFKCLDFGFKVCTVNFCVKPKKLLILDRKLPQQLQTYYQQTQSWFGTFLQILLSAFGIRIVCIFYVQDKYFVISLKSKVSINKMHRCYLPTNQPTYLSTYLPTYLPTYVLTFLLTFISTYLPTYLPTCLPLCVPAYLHSYLTTNLPTYLTIYPPSYVPTY